MPIVGRTVILVDDGIATGSTVRAALRAIRQKGPAKLVLAVPVGAPDTMLSLQRECDEVVCLVTPDPFYAVGAHYEHFDQTTDKEVRDLLADRVSAAAEAE
jgi:putative phosphoribosyl transferase